MIRQGELCKGCGAKCKNDVSEREPIEIECPLCDGVGCDECDNGNIEITECPNRYCRDVAKVVPLVDLFAKGAMPIAGGVLDQSAWFIEAARTLERDEEQLKAERNAR